MKVLGDLLGPPHSTDKTTVIIKVRMLAKIKANYKWYQLYKYEYLSIKWFVRYLYKAEKQYSTF